jgi:hypothetical protein
MDILFTGHIEGIRYADNAAIVTASEIKKGYKKKDGVVVDDELVTFKFIFKPYFKNYIAAHFTKGMYVKIKGTMLPYAKNHVGEIIDGYSIIGQTIDIAAYPTKHVRNEKRIIKESIAKSDESPDLNAYTAPDF